MMSSTFQIITFYEFKEFAEAELPDLKELLKVLMKRLNIKGTIVLAREGFNSTVCGGPRSVDEFVREAGSILNTTLNFKSTFHLECPFRRVDVKIKPEIVTLKRPVNVP